MCARTVCTLVCAQRALSLWLCIFGGCRKQRSRSGWGRTVRILKFVSIPDLKRKEPQTTVGQCLYSGRRCWKLLLVTGVIWLPLGRRKLWDVAKRVLDVTMIGYDDLMENELEIYIERERESGIEVYRMYRSCWRNNLCWREMLFIRDFPSSCRGFWFFFRVGVHFFSQLLAFLLFNRKSISAVGNLFRFFNREEKFQSMCDTRATAPSNIWTRKVYFV